MRTLTKPLFALLLTSCILVACSALPASGPTEHEVLDAEKGGDNPLGFRVVPITPPVVTTLQSDTGPSLARLAGGAALPRVDAIGPGDTLAIAIYEIGNGVFAGGGASVAGPSPGDVAGVNSSASGTRLPAVQVDGHGDIVLPFIGRIHAAGRTTTELADLIRDGLKRVSQDPQVLVTIVENVASSVFVQGDVHDPGRKKLTLNHERLLDLVALSGGSSFPSSDMQVELTRSGRSVRVPLRRLEDDPAENIAAQPGDRLRLTHQARSFTIFGAAGKVAEVPLEAARVSLAEGVARGGGPQNERADPNAIFLFRFEPLAVGRALGVPPPPAATAAGVQPVIYQLDMMNPGSYFLAQNFALHDKDLIYVANARTDRISKFVGIIYNLAFPLVLGRQLAN